MVTQQDDIGFAVGHRYLAERMVRDDGTVDVWRGRDRELDRDVAITRLRAPRRPRRARRRALRTVRTAARLDLPGLVDVVDLIRDRRAVHVVTEWLDADDLERRVARDGPVPPATAAMWGLQLLGTLEQVHAAGIVHGAVGPRSVLIDDGAARLGDLCAAVFAGGPRPPTRDGSLAFTAPEVVRGERAGAPSDLYGLGATLYVAVEGAPPFDAAGPVLLGTTAVEHLPRPTGCDGVLAVLLPALLRTDPTARPSADDVRRDLSAVAGAGPPSRAPQTAPAAGEDATQPAEAQHALRVADRPAAQEAAVADIDWSQVYAAMADDAGRRHRRLAAAVLTLVLLLGGVAAAVRRDTGRRDVDLPMAPVMTVAGDPHAVIGPA